MNFVTWLKEWSFFFDILEKAGNFLIGIASIWAIRFGSNALTEHWKIKKSNAASEALSRFNLCIHEIIDIANRSELYKYPSFPQEISVNTKEKIHPERPARMIEMKANQLRKDMHTFLCQLSGKERIKLLQLISKLQKYTPHLSSAVYISIKANDGDVAAKEQLKPIRYYLDEYETKLTEIDKEVEQLLAPIIEMTKK
jgi:hypothetical protein